jgi:hypothetical protein
LLGRQKLYQLSYSRAKPFLKPEPTADGDRFELLPIFSSRLVEEAGFEPA